MIGPESESGLSHGHAFLILSRSDSTMILKTGKEINELEKSGFDTHSQTVFACNMGNNKYVVQVTGSEARLLRGREQVQKLPLNLSSNVIKASCADPHLILMSEDGELLLLSLDFSLKTPKLAMTKANLKNKSKLINLCAYKDTSGLFSSDIVSNTVHILNKPTLGQ